MKGTLLSIILLLPLFLLSCAPRQASAPTFFREASAADAIKRLRTYPLSRDILWDAAVQVTTDNEYPLAVIAKDTGVLTTEWVLVETDSPMGIGETRSSRGRLAALADFPATKGLFGEIGIWTKCRYKYSIRVNAIGPDSAKVQINPHIECWEKQQRKDWTPCNSRGLLEEQYFKALESKLPH